jgi:hypothetical protein
MAYDNHLQNTRSFTEKENTSRTTNFRPSITYRDGTSHRERKEVALQMFLLNVKDRTIRRYIGISERSMRYIRKTFRETGEVVRTPACAGRPRILDSLDANVSYHLFSRLMCDFSVS